MQTLLKMKVTLFLVAVLIGLFLTYAIITEVVRLQPAIEQRVTIDSHQLESSIRQIAELSTLVYNYTDIGFFDERSVVELFGREVALPGTRRQLITRFDGTVRMGIDVSQISVSVEEYAVTVMLPQAVIQVHTIDMDSIQILDERTGVFVNFNLEEYAEIIAQWKREVESRDGARELLEQSQQSAEEVISVLLRSTLPEGYSINFIWQ